MREILGVFVVAAVSLVDPVAWLGFALAGAFVRPFLLALSAGVVWAVVLLVAIRAMSVTAAPMYPVLFCGKVLAAIAATAAVYWVADRRRKSRKRDHQS